nr:hypothetical protein [Candidatus Sigynarchaeota archaeon]
MVPRIDVDVIFNDVWTQIKNEMGISEFVDGYKYSDEDFIKSLAYKALYGKPMAVSLDKLNDLLFKELGREPRCIDKAHQRYERLVPNASQVNTFLRKLPPTFLARLEAALFKALIDKALEKGLITYEIEVYIDFHKLDYYGADQNATNSGITNVNNGKGTSKARKYSELMISSGRGMLFANTCLSRQGSMKEAWMFQALMTLLSWGFTIKRVIADREFSTYDVLAVMGFLGVPYTGPMKRTPAIRKLIDQFIDGTSKAVVSFNLQPSRTTRFKVGAISVHVIMKAEPGKRIRDLRAALTAGTITRAEARKHVHSFITTESAPFKATSLNSWGMRIAAIIGHRWRIETGFRVSDDFSPSSHARSNRIKTFWLVTDRINYNCWKVQQAPHRKLKDVPKSWREGQTKDRFVEVATELLVNTHADYLAGVA